MHSQIYPRAVHARGWLYVLPYGQMSLWGGWPEFVYCIIPFIQKSKPSKNFMSMFMGFMDGDGYFDIGEQKQYNKVTKALTKSTIRIRLATNVNVRDLPTLNFFVKVLGVGSISTMPKREQVRVIFSKKDLVTVIIPLIKLYNLEFLTGNRAKQYALLTYILENNIVHWEDVKFTPSIPVFSIDHLVNLDFFADWIVGFTMAEGSFGFKATGAAFYQIKQKGIENYNIIKAICLSVAGREAKPTKADSADCYQLTLTSIIDVQKVVNFFSSPNNHPLYGYKLEQYNIWLFALKRSSRYKSIKNLNEINSNE
jgi:hypothetical protein